MWLRFFAGVATAAEMFQGYLTQAVEVPAPGGFFGPGDVEVLLDALDSDDGLFCGPVFVAVDEEPGAIIGDAESFLHDADTPEVGFHVETDFEFAGRRRLFRPFAR